MCVCVCVCVRERERERELCQLGKQFSEFNGLVYVMVNISSPNLIAEMQILISLRMFMNG